MSQVSIEKKGLREDVAKVLAEVLKQFDFDIENLLEARPEELESLIFNAVLSVIPEEEVPFIDWICMVEKEEAEELKDEGGNFVVN